MENRGKIILIIIGIVIFGTIALIYNVSKQNNIDNYNINYDCQKNESSFTDYSWFFEDKSYSYIDWCEECIKNNGRPQISEDAGPFCNLKTKDADKKCTDSNQCEGFCIAEEMNSNSGKCTEFKQLSDGCGWLEIINGGVAELCVS